MEIDVMECGALSACQNMEQDYLLLQELGSRNKPLLRFYTFNEPCVTYGYFLKPESFLKEEIPSAKRPTGGGILFHGRDFPFSFLLPKSSPFFTSNTLENYAFIHKIIKEALIEATDNQNFSLFNGSAIQEEGFCFTKPCPFDLLYQGKKCVGGAQRRTKYGYLHQGSIYFQEVEDKILTCIKENKATKALFHEKSHAIYPLLFSGIEEIEARLRLKNAITKAFKNKFLKNLQQIYLK